MRERSERSCRGRIVKSVGRMDFSTLKLESEMNPRDPISREKKRVGYEEIRRSVISEA